MNNSNNLKDLKVIVFDLDGTLLTDDGIVGEETEILIKALHNYDVKFSFASGRLHSNLIEYARQLEINTPLISLDGCLIKNHPEGQIIYQSFVKEKHVKKALDFAENYGLYAALCHGEAIYFTEKNSVIPQMMEKFGAVYEEVASYDSYIRDTLETVIVSDDSDSMKYVRQKMEFPYSVGLDTSYFKSQRHDKAYYLEIRKKGASKGKGLMRLLKHLKIRPQQAAVLGDWYNDLSLFKTPVFKIAVANAIPEIKRLSNIITKNDNNREGAAEFLEMVLKAKREA